MNLKRLQKNDGTWDRFRTQWQEQCGVYEEEFENYASASLGTLEDECGDGTENLDSGVFALADDSGTYHAACFLNSAHIKGFVGKVLRVRHLVLSPYYDFEDLALEQYATTLAHAFTSILKVSEKELDSKHIKIHYRSPYDRTFFAAFALTIKSSSGFESVESKGMWLHLTKA